MDRARRVLRDRGIRAVALGAVDEVRARFELRRHRRLEPQSFVVDGVEHTQLIHLHNRTWRNERAVEVPLARAFLEQHEGPVLELGNVLTNYGLTGHLVVDKYERRPGVHSIDVVDYHPAERFGAIITVSTLEHVGWDEDPRDPEKIPRAIQNLRRLLLPSGRLFSSCPLSYNPHLDALIAAGALGADRQAFLVRDDPGEPRAPGRWTQSDQATAFARARLDRYGGSAIWVAEFPP